VAALAAHDARIAAKRSTNIAAAGGDLDDDGIDGGFDRHAEFRRARVDYLNERRRALSMQNEVMARNLVPADRVAAYWREILMVTRTHMLALPSTAAPEIAQAPAHDVVAIATILRRRIHRMLEELSRAEAIPPEFRKPAPPQEEVSSPAAE
jgi:hypothetical protein